MGVIRARTTTGRDSHLEAAEILFCVFEVLASLFLCIADPRAQVYRKKRTKS